MIQELSVDLAYKVGDPVATYDTDGILFSKDDRLRYINQGVSRLFMYLNNLEREYRPKFVDDLVIDDINLGLNNGNIYLDAEVQLSDNTYKDIYFREIKEVFVTYTYGNKDYTVRAEKVESYEYQNVRYGHNAMYKPSIKEGKIFWTLFNKQIKLLPQEIAYKALSLTYKPDISLLTYETTLPFTRDYYGLALLFSALEAMCDLNNQQKYQIIKAEINGLLTLLGQNTQLKEMKDGK